MLVKTRSALAHAILACAVLVAGLPESAQSQSTPWPVKRPYIRFYDTSPWILPVPSAPGPLVRRLGDGGFRIDSRYDSATALAGTFVGPELAPPPPAEFSTVLSIQEELVARTYVSRFEQWGLAAPEYGEIITDGREERFVFYAHPGLDDATAAEYGGGSCTAPRGTTIAGVAVNPGQLGNIDNPVVAFELRSTLAHELLHGSQATMDRCSQAEWIQEGGPEGYAMHAAWLGDIDEPLLRQLVQHDKQPYQRRKYYLPLDLQGMDIQDLGARGGLDGATPQTFKEIMSDNDYEAYATGSYFRYLLEAQPSGSLARALFYSNPKIDNSTRDRSEYYALVKEHLGIDAPRHLAMFFTEYASYGGGRYKIFPARDGNLATTAQREEEIRNSWLAGTFNCAAEPDVVIDGSRATAKRSVVIPNMMPLAGRCLRVAWSGVEPSVNLTVQVLVENDVQANSIWLGQAYVDGASHNKPPHPYCYQNVTGGGGSYGEPILNDRATAAPVDACVHRKPAIRNVTLDGKTYRAATFTTKFKIGAEPGEAVFIITNAAENGADSRIFDATALVSHDRVKAAWQKSSGTGFDGAAAADGPADIWKMAGNSTDVWFNAATQASRDVLIDGADARGMVDKLAKLEGRGALTFVGGSAYMMQVADTDDGVAAVLMSLDGRHLMVGGDDIDFAPADECGLANRVDVRQRDDEGLEVAFTADVLDMPKFTMSAMAGGMDCDKVRAAIHDRVAIDAYFPDGSLHLYDSNIERTFPNGYDESVEESLTPIGVADLGGLPRRIDQPTFLDGFLGTALLSGPPSPTNGAPPSGGPSAPGAPSGGAAVSATGCTSPESATVIAALDAIAVPCECSCGLVRSLPAELQNAATKAVPLISASPECADDVSASMARASERMQQCLMDTCRALIGKC